MEPDRPPGPSGLNGTNGATVPSANTANTANNALALGGIPASGYTRNDCASITGQIKGFAIVPAEPGVVFTSVGIQYNCSGQGVEAVRIGLGAYDVRFPGNPAVIAMTTVIRPEGGILAADARNLQPGEWQVTMLDNAEFELLVP